MRIQDHFSISVNLDVGCGHRRVSVCSAQVPLGHSSLYFIMRLSSVGGGRILRCTLSVRLSVRPVIVYIITSVTCFRQPCGRAASFVLFIHLRAAYCTAISAAQACIKLVTQVKKIRSYDLRFLKKPLKPRFLKPTSTVLFLYQLTNSFYLSTARPYGF